MHYEPVLLLSLAARMLCQFPLVVSLAAPPKTLTLFEWIVKERLNGFNRAF